MRSVGYSCCCTSKRVPESMRVDGWRKRARTALGRTLVSHAIGGALRRGADVDTIYIWV